MTVLLLLLAFGSLGCLQTGISECGNGNFCYDGLECRRSVVDNRSYCVSPTCGNGSIEFGEACDDENDVNDDDCTNLCQTWRCGNKIVDGPYEECDDGNDTNSDDCTNLCQIPEKLPPECERNDSGAPDACGDRATR